MNVPHDRFLAPAKDVARNNVRHGGKRVLLPASTTFDSLTHGDGARREFRSEPQTLLMAPANEGVAGECWAGFRGCHLWRQGVMTLRAGAMGGPVASLNNSVPHACSRRGELVR